MRNYFSEVESNEEEGSTNIISTSSKSKRTKTKSELEETKLTISEKTGQFSNNSTFNLPKQSNTNILSNIPGEWGMIYLHYQDINVYPTPARIVTHQT